MALLDGDRDRARIAIGPRKPQGRAFAVSATTLAATPAEATPESTSAVLGHSQAPITPVACRTAPHIELMRSRTSSSFPAAINWRSSRYCWRASRRTCFASA
jgi:hypothetical protein